MIREFGADDLFDEVSTVQYLSLRLHRLAGLVEERVEPGQVRLVGLLLTGVDTVRSFTLSKVSQIFLFKLNRRQF